LPLTELIEFDFKLFEAFGKMWFSGFGFFWSFGGKRIIYWNV
jgi:hypothetical protein